MATMIEVWFPNDRATNHAQAGGIRPGKNRYEDKMAERLIREGLVVPYTGQDKPEKKSKADLDISDEESSKDSLKPKSKKRFRRKY